MNWLDKLVDFVAMIAWMPPDCQIDDWGVRNLKDIVENFREYCFREINGILGNEMSLRFSIYIIVLF